MAIKALNVGKTFKHVLSFDKRPPEGAEGHDTWAPTTWNCRVLDSRLLGVLKDKSTKITINPNRPDDDIGTEVNQHGYNFEVCALGLDKPENFLDDDNNVVPWHTMKRNIAGQSYEVVTPDTLGRIPETAIAELAERIIAGNSLTVAEGNGSASQS